MLNKKSKLEREKGCARDVFAESTDISRIFYVNCKSAQNCNRSFKLVGFQCMAQQNVIKTCMWMDIFEIVRTQIRYIFIKISLSHIRLLLRFYKHNDDDDENWEKNGREYSRLTTWMNLKGVFQANFEYKWILWEHINIKWQMEDEWIKLKSFFFIFFILVVCMIGTLKNLTLYFFSPLSLFIELLPKGLSMKIVGSETNLSVKCSLLAWIWKKALFVT